MGDTLTIAVINGPNLNILGVREPHIYSNETWEQIENRLRSFKDSLGVELKFFQSNHEGAIIDFIQNHLTFLDGIVVNPASLSGTGYGILDALLAVNIPYVEVHLSNIYSREEWHQKSIFASKAVGQIVGFKGFGYELGLMALHNFIRLTRPRGGKETELRYTM